MISNSFITGPSNSTWTFGPPCQLPLMTVPTSAVSAAPPCLTSSSFSWKFPASKPHTNPPGLTGAWSSHSMVTSPLAVRSGSTNDTSAWRIDPSGAARSTSTCAGNSTPPILGVIPAAKSPSAPILENVTGTSLSARPLRSL
ncbi:hypothetical protein LCGC14_1556900 [marine sediment metagenome]|uniref:Uncharacterized protein n=1 Tax=marine sediment metagenome TaxID=412755 RepID=A0A0F9LPK0_9ZZZZ